jgi:hypothetical protein
LTKQLDKDTANIRKDIYKISVDEVYEALGTSPQGLTQAQAEQRQKEEGKKSY